MFDRVRQWNDRQRDAARVRRDAAGERLAAMRGSRSDEKPIATFAGVSLFADRLVARPTLAHPQTTPGEAPVTGVEASVDESGSVSARATLTRAAVPGLHGWQKKMDDRQAWLQIDGPGFRWVVPISPSETAAARQFAAVVTGAGRNS